MLDSLRKKKNSWVSVVMVLMIGGVMAFYGVGKFSSSAGTGTAAYVNGEAISQNEFRQELQRRLYQYQALLGGQYDEKLLNALQIPQRTLDDLVHYKLLEQQASRMDIRVPDVELIDNIKTIPYYQKNGKFSPELYSKVENKGQEEKWRRERLQVAKLQNYVSDQIHVTPEDVKVANLLRATKAELEFAKIDFKKLADKQKPSDAQVAQFLKTAKQNDLFNYFEAHKKDFLAKPSYSIRQVRLGLPFQASDAKKREVKQKIEDLSKKITPQNFTEMARSFSDDEHAKKGGEVGWVTAGTLEQPVEKVIEKMQVGQISPPIETSFGYYIVFLKDKKNEQAPKLDDVKKQVAQKMLAEKNQQDYVEQKRKDWNAALAAGKSIEADLKKEKIEIQKTGVFSLGQGYIPTLGQSEVILDAVFELTKNKPLPKRLFRVQDYDYFIRLKSIELPKEKDLAKEREATEKSYLTGLQTEVLTAWVNTLEKKSSVKKEALQKPGARDPEPMMD